MDILTQKRITDNGDRRGYFRYCIEYVYRDKIEPGEELIFTKGYGVCDLNPDYTYKQMMAVKKYFNKTGDNPVMHFVVSFDIKNVCDKKTACKYTELIALFFRIGYQVIVALHKEYQRGSLYHAHFVVNTVNIHDGRLYHSGTKELYELARYINSVTGNYCKTEIKKPGED